MRIKLFEFRLGHIFVGLRIDIRAPLKELENIALKPFWLIGDSSEFWEAKSTGLADDRDNGAQDFFRKLAQLTSVEEEKSPAWICSVIR